MKPTTKRERIAALLEYIPRIMQEHREMKELLKRWQASSTWLNVAQNQKFFAPLQDATRSLLTRIIADPAPANCENEGE